ncbi:MAG: hypothetical protein J7J31_00460 [Helicobacteraceae bacterium]|nr:hypothetical protein [Helicobacteraceae bacterium]
MLKNEDYELLKENLGNYQRIFEKLNSVANQFGTIEYDESGFCLEEEETLKRHWLKLGMKVIEGLHEVFSDYTIELLQHKGLDERVLKITFLRDDFKSELHIDYSENGTLSISQIS